MPAGAGGARPSCRAPGTLRARAAARARAAGCRCPGATCLACDSDALHEAWNAWTEELRAPGPGVGRAVLEVRRLSIASDAEQRAWMLERLQPYRVEAYDGNADGLLTGYYEPLMDAARLPGNGYSVPLYRPPASGSASPGIHASRSRPCPRPRPRCKAVRLPGCATRSMRWCCTSRARAGCA